MNSIVASISAVEAIMLMKFNTEPFHNLRLLYRQDVLPSLGGTCSDKTLSFLVAAKQAGFDAYLHSAFIDGQEIHRLARVHINNKIFFADVGNGWPSLKLYPADRQISYRCFGMTFRTKIVGTRVIVFLEKNGKESPQFEIDIHGKPEKEIQDDIKSRFNSGIKYPFSNSLRFSLIVGERFLFLRGDQLEIYSDRGFELVKGIKKEYLSTVLREYFGYNIERLK